MAEPRLDTNRPDGRVRSFCTYLLNVSGCGRRAEDLRTRRVKLSRLSNLWTNNSFR